MRSYKDELENLVRSLFEFQDIVATCQQLKLFKTMIVIQRTIKKIPFQISTG